jgi:hypothetical protein
MTMKKKRRMHCMQGFMGDFRCPYRYNVHGALGDIPAAHGRYKRRGNYTVN